jgi:hypothetical protein
MPLTGHIRQVLAAKPETGSGSDRADRVAGEAAFVLGLLVGQPGCTASGPGDSAVPHARRVDRPRFARTVRPGVPRGASMTIANC